MPDASHSRKAPCADGELSVDEWMELFYASLLDHDPAKLAQRLQLVKRRGNNQKLHRAASHSQREILRAVLKAIDDFERQPPRDDEEVA